MKILSVFSGDGLRGRSLRSAFFTLLNTGSENLLRLVGNLVLTRLLFPEAFGIMALVQVVITGLRMFSDMGIRMSIIQNERGEDPAFLDTAWTLQVGRGVVLWLATWLAAGPVAAFYDIPILAELLPVAGLVALFQGLNSTKLVSANRKLVLGRVTLLELSTQVAGLLVLIALAYLWQSVWALVVGSLVAPFLLMVASHLSMPGRINRFRFEPAAARELVRFGKYIFLSTIAGFLVLQADRAILGKYVSLSDLALYTIALMLASIPLLVQRKLSDRVLLSLYSRCPPGESAENYNNIARARLLVVGGSVAMAGVLALVGNWLAVVLYDPRYEAAGPLLVLMAIATLPGVITKGYATMVVTRGDSGRYAALMMTSAFLRVAVLLVGVSWYGVIGAALSPLVANILFYPALLWFIWPYKGWVPRQDIGFALAGCVIAALAVWLNQDVLRQALDVFALP